MRYFFNEALDDRKLIAYDKNNEYRFLYVKPQMPTHVGAGNRGHRHSWKDTIMEEGKDIYELLDLKIGKMQTMHKWAKSPEVMRDVYSLRSGDQVSEYSQAIFRKQIYIARYNRAKGSVELAPITDLSDVILDIVESRRDFKV